METVLMEVKNRVGVITLNGPEKLNAFNHKMVAELTQAFKEMDADERVHVILLKAAGRCFGAGYDVSPDAKPFTTIKEWRKEGVDSNAMMYAAWDNKKPVIAQVHSYCFGGACDLVMACDLAICSDDAIFSVPEIQFNTHPSFLIMPYTVMMKNAKMMLMTGDRFSAEEAKEFGIVNKVVPKDSLEEEVEMLAAKLVKVPTPAMESCKKSINQTYEMAGMRNAIFMSEEAFAAVKVQQTPESKKFFEIAETEGMKAAFKWRDEYFED